MDIADLAFEKSLSGRKTIWHTFSILCLNSQFFLPSWNKDTMSRGAAAIL